MVKKQTGQNGKQSYLFANGGVKSTFDSVAQSAHNYYLDIIYEASADYQILHPNNSLNLLQNIRSICLKPLSTRSVEMLENMYTKTTDVIARSMIAKKIYALQRDYLQSYKEYSDRALILLTEREKLFDKWEGIYILGCFATKHAISYLKKRSAEEKSELLKQTIERAIQKIELNAKKKIQERGF